MKVYNGQIDHGKYEQNIEIECLGDGIIGINLSSEKGKTPWVEFNLEQANDIVSVLKQKIKVIKGLEG